GIAPHHVIHLALAGLGELDHPHTGDQYLVAHVVLLGATRPVSLQGCYLAKSMMVNAASGRNTLLSAAAKLRASKAASLPPPGMPSADTSFSSRTLCPEANRQWPVRWPDSSLTMYSTTCATNSGAISALVSSSINGAVRAEMAAGARVQTRIPNL